MNITVYLGAFEGKDASLKQAVRELGTWIGESGNALVYGGSKSGLMGEIAESVLQAGGTVTGVEPKFFMDAELQYDGLTKLIVTKDMTERKTKMIELGDAFIAFPGGTGTLEEISEVMSKVSLKQLDAPCIENRNEALKKIEKCGKESIPIMRTLYNFYLQFGMLDNAAKISTVISQKSDNDVTSSPPIL